MDAVYAAYCVNEVADRPEAVYTMMENSGIHDITLEMVMLNGEELPDMDEFLKLWIAYLGKITSSRGQKLLPEAVELCNDTEQLLENARDYHVEAGCRKMCREVVSFVGFEKEDYEHGISRRLFESSQEWFWKCFCHWKHTISISEEEKQQYLEWVEQLVTRRLNGIMEGNYRKYYGECAGYIAALGEVRESRGEIGGKQNVMAEYKAMYSRRSAFHNALRAFGMRDARRR